MEWLSVLAEHSDWLVSRYAALTYSRIALAAHGWLAANAPEDTISALLQLANMEDPPTREHAKSALAALSKHKPVHAALVNDRRLKSILTRPRSVAAAAAGAVEDRLTETRYESLILRHLTNTEDGRRQLMNSPNRDTLSAVLRHILLDDGETSTHLSYVFAAITCDEESKQLLGACRPRLCAAASRDRTAHALPESICP